MTCSDEVEPGDAWLLCAAASTALWDSLVCMAKNSFTAVYVEAGKTSKQQDKTKQRVGNVDGHGWVSDA